MATTTFTELSLRGGNRSKGIMRTMFDRVIDAREREARRIVENHFATFGHADGNISPRQSFFESSNRERS